MEVYKAVILKIEKGLFTWSSDIIKKAENMLDRAVSKYKLRKENDNKKVDREDYDKRSDQKIKEKTRKELGLPTRSGEKVIYCLEFNKHKCEKDGSHEGKFAGKDVVKQHVCRVCLNQDKEKRNHAESDPVCPNKTA